MPDYNMTIRKRRVNVMYPTHMVGPGDNDRIRRKIGAAIEAGERSGQFQFKPKLKGATALTWKWKVLKQKPGRKAKRASTD